MHFSKVEAAGQYGNITSTLSGQCLDETPIITSNRPVDDWGKLLGDSAAVTAMKVLTGMALSIGT